MRRALPPFLLAAIGVLLWVAGPALSVGPYVPRAQDFEMTVPSGGARAARAASAVIRAPKRFDLVGARWSSRAKVTIDVRVRRDGGRWSRWVTMDHAEMDSTRGTEPVWTGGSDDLQLRVHGRVRGLRLHFVNATGSATPADRVKTALRRAVHPPSSRSRPRSRTRRRPSPPWSRATSGAPTSARRRRRPASAPWTSRSSTTP